MNEIREVNEVAETEAEKQYRIQKELEVKFLPIYEDFIIKMNTVCKEYGIEIEHIPAPIFAKIA